MFHFNVPFSIPAMAIQLVFLATLKIAVTTEGEGASLIPVGSHTIAGELGTDVELPCNKPGNEEIQWVLPSGDVASKNSSQDRLTQMEGNLKIANVSWDDHGDYTCMVVNGSLNDTLQFKIFQIPSYYMEGIIIVSINSALLLLFLVCLIISVVRNKMKAAKERARKGSQKYKYTAPKKVPDVHA